MGHGPFMGKPPLFLPGTWLLLLGAITFCYSIVSIGIVYGDTENEDLKIVAFILLVTSFIIGAASLGWNFYFYERNNPNLILRQAYMGVNKRKLHDENLEE